nr:DUF6777 domain-containing protein [Kitasatospora fiedleri]
MLAGAVLVGLGVALGVVATGGSGGGGTAQAVEMQPVAAAGQEPFTDSVANGGAPDSASPSGSAPAASGSPSASGGSSASGSPAASGGAVDGGQPGLYGGTREVASCDVPKLSGYLAANTDKARAWAGVEGIGSSQIDGYLNGLTPVVLRQDTRVTNHGYQSGQATRTRPSCSPDGRAGRQPGRAAGALRLRQPADAAERQRRHVHRDGLVLVPPGRGGDRAARRGAGEPDRAGGPGDGPPVRPSRGRHGRDRRVGLARRLRFRLLRREFRDGDAVRRLLGTLVRRVRRVRRVVRAVLRRFGFARTARLLRAVRCTGFAGVTGLAERWRVLRTGFRRSVRRGVEAGRLGHAVTVVCWWVGAPPSGSWQVRGARCVVGSGGGRSAVSGAGSGAA